MHEHPLIPTPVSSQSPEGFLESCATSAARENETHRLRRKVEHLGNPGFGASNHEVATRLPKPQILVMCDGHDGGLARTFDCHCSHLQSKPRRSLERAA